MKRKKGRISSSEKEFVVKTSFGSILREPKLAEPVRILADTVSRISNRGAIIYFQRLSDTLYRERYPTSGS